MAKPQYSKPIKIPTGVKFLVDTREQKPLICGGEGIPYKRKKLDAGDYSIEVDGKDCSRDIVIEHKLPHEFLGCIGAKRDFFEKQLERLQKVNLRYLLIRGCTQEEIRDPFIYGSLVSPESVWGSLISLEVKWGMKVHFESTRHLAHRWVVKTLIYYYHLLRRGKLGG